MNCIVERTQYFHRGKISIEINDWTSTFDTRVGQPTQDSGFGSEQARES